MWDARQRMWYITVQPDGTVTSASVARSIPLLDTAAVAAVLQWRYAPRSGNCYGLSVTVNFVLPTDTSAPANLQASVAGNVLSLGWLPPTLAVSAYLTEAGSAPGLSDVASQQLPASPPALSVPVPNGTYFIRVRAVRPTGTSAPSNEVTVVVGCSQPPPAPDAFAMAQGSGGNAVQYRSTARS